LASYDSVSETAATIWSATAYHTHNSKAAWVCQLYGEDCHTYCIARIASVRLPDAMLP